MQKIIKEIDHTIYNKKVKQDFQIALVSDFHLNLEGSYFLDFENLYHRLYTIHPDYICIPGDLIDQTKYNFNPTFQKKVFGFLNALSEIAPVILSLGNHDRTIKTDTGWMYDANMDFFEKVTHQRNVHLVHDSIFSDGRILIAGYTQPFEMYFNSKGEDKEEMKKDLAKKQFLLNPEDDTVPKVILIHSPQHLSESDISILFKNYDLLLSGHMHNGLVPPIIDEVIGGSKGIISPSNSLFPNNARGTVRLDNKYLIISGGITKISKTAPKILQFADNFFPMQIDVLNMTNDLEFADYKRTQKYLKK